MPPTTGADTAVLRLQGLHFAWPGDPALVDRLDAVLGPGLHALAGDSGSGKTTLLRLLAGEDLPCTGQRWLRGRSFDADPAAWRQAACWVDPRDAAWDGLTPAELRTRLQQRHPALDTAAWQRHVDGFGLAPHAFKTLHMLSTGMRRKAALAAQLASGCTLLLLDEPMAGLDAPAVAWLVAALNALGRQPGFAALIVSGRWPEGLACDGSLRLGGG